MIKDEENQVRSDAEREPTGVRSGSERVDGGAIMELCALQTGQDPPPVLDPNRTYIARLRASGVPERTLEWLQLSKEDRIRTVMF